MSPPTVSETLWLWLAIAGLGLFHGINPAMGWLFAVALGLNRHSERVVWLALLPIGLGHALAIAVILILVLTLGLILEPGLLRPFAAAMLLGWAGWHALYGRRHKVRFGMQVSLGGLFLWSYADLKRHRLTPGTQTIIERRVAFVPQKIQKRQGQFVKVPWVWIDRLAKARHISTYRVALQVLHLHWKRNGQPFPLPNGKKHWQVHGTDISL